jgi:shikimate kinase
MKNIYLIGMPLVGKTTIGRLLSKRLNLNFVDMDETIEVNENKTITQIFELQGENYFRDLETNLLKELYDKDNLVIGTGGGIIKRLENKELMNGIIIYLKVDINVLMKRNNDNSRPLLNNNSLLTLYNERKQLYFNFCNIIVIVNNDINQTLDLLEDIINDKDINN